MPTLQDNLDRANPNNLPADLQRLRDANNNGFGAILAGLVIPTEFIRTALTSLSTHVEPEAGVIVALTDGTDTYTIAPSDGTPTAKAALATGIATVVYDANGVASITFEAAKTAYTVTKLVMPAGIGTALAANV